MNLKQENGLLFDFKRKGKEPRMGSDTGGFRFGGKQLRTYPLFFVFFVINLCEIMRQIWKMVLVCHREWSLKYRGW